jgi:hypothetical protein
MPNESVDELINELEALRIQEASVLRRLVLARETETRARLRSQVTRTTRDQEIVFSVGDRVQITNRVKGAFGRAVTTNDRRATVTRITPTRIYFNTVNGHSTWRARSNLRLVNDNED